MGKPCFFVSLLASLLFMMLPSAVLAADLRIETSPPGVAVNLDGSTRISALTPLVLPVDLAGSYALTLGGGPWRPQHATLEWTAGSEPRIVQKARLRAMTGSLLPGAGAWLSGSRRYGLAQGAAMIYLLQNCLAATFNVDDSLARYQWSEDGALFERIIARDTHKHWQAHRDRQIAFTALLAGIMSAESWWLNKPLTGRSRNGTLVLDVTPSSRGRALAASLLFPGLGQAYRGQERSALYLAGEVMAIQGIMDSYLRRRIAWTEYGRTRDAYQNGGEGAPEKQTVDRLWRKQEKATRELLAYSGLAAGIWLANIADIILTDPGRGRGRLTIQASPAGRPSLAWRASF